MGFRRSQITSVLIALEYLNLSFEDVAKITYKELEQKLVDYEVPDAVWVELLAIGSGPKPRIRNIVHTKPISRQRFLAMIKQSNTVKEEIEMI